MTPEEFVDEVLIAWTNLDDRVALVEPTLDVGAESWRVEFENGDAIVVSVQSEAEYRARSGR